MAKSNSASAKPAAEAAKKSKKPRFKGINHPSNVHKAFRSSGNTVLIRAALAKDRRKPAPITTSSK